MVRRPPVPFRWLLSGLATALILSLLPSRMLRPWTRDVAEIVMLPAMPLGDAGTRFRTWLRPGTDPRGNLPSPALEQLEQQLEEYKALHEAERLTNQDLREKMAQYELAQQFGAVPARLITANVVAENIQSSGRIIRLKSGSWAGVVPGTVAVYNGVHLIGRIEEVSGLTAFLRPITDPAIGSIEARILAAHGAPENRDEPPITFLKPAGDGTLVGDVIRNAGIEIGDVVRLNDLNDPAWPATARAMIVGYVESIEPKPDNPLRSTVTVRPRFLADNLSSVILKVEDTQDDAP